MKDLNLDRLAEYKVVSLDTETTGLHWYRDKMFGLAIAARDGKDVATGYYDLRDKPRVIEAVNRQIKYVPKIVNHNIKFDAHFMREGGIKVPLDRIECTSVRAALINEHGMLSLDAQGTEHLGMGKAVGIYEELAKLFGGEPTREAQMSNLHRAPVALAARYARPDPEIALRLWLWQEEEIARQDLHQIWSIERQLTPVLIKIEARGIRVDEERAHREWKSIDVRIEKAQALLNKFGKGQKVNANSPPQMRELFGCRKTESGWQTDKGFPLELTEGGVPSINKDLLIALDDAGDPRAKSVRLLRQIIKARSFLKDHIIGHAVNGRVYPNYNQCKNEFGRGVGPGRLSMDDPAMQQIPARDIAVAEIVRPCFLPEVGHKWACADWEQFEFRWFAHYTDDPNIIAVYKENPNADYHKIVADITGLPRNPRYAGDANAKQINLGLVFGMGEGTLAAEMGLDYTTRKETNEKGEVVREWRVAGPKAKAKFAIYHGAIPGVRTLTERASSIARARGFVKTVDGRHIRFPGGKFTHKAAGLVFQGTSAGCMKAKMIALDRMADKHGFLYLLSVHDEHDPSLPEKEVKRLVPLIKAELEKFNGSDEFSPSCRVPILSSIKVGDNWWEACKKD